MSDISCSAAIDDVPDWRSAVASENAWLLPAYRTGGLFFSVPRRVHLARKADRSPDFFLEFFSDRNASGDDQALYASLHIGMECRDVRAGADRTSIPSTPNPVVVPVSFSAGAAWHFESGDCREAAPVAWDGARRATLDARIAARTGDLLYAQLAAGTIVAARVAVECRFAGVLPRLETAALFDAGALLARLRTLEPGAPSLAFGRLVSWLQEPPPDLVRFEGGDPADAASLRAFTLAGWLNHHFGRPGPCRRISDGPHITLTPPEGAPGLTRWDLRTPLLTELPRFLDLDPFTPIVAEGGRERVTAFTRVGPLPEDRLTLNVAVAGGFPENIRNCDAIDVTLCVDKEHARSGMTTAQSVALYPGGRGSRTVALAFKRSGLKAYRARLELVVDDAAMELPWFDGPGEYLHLGPGDLPLSVVTVRATAPLLEQARLAVAIAGTAHAAEIVPEAPSASFLLAPGGALRVVVSAHERAEAGPAIVLDLPGPSVDLDCDSFPQYGPQTTRVRVAFDEAVPACRFAFLPETAQEPIVLAFTPEQSSATFGYFADRIFRNRYRFRRVFDDDDGCEWSDYQPPGRDLILTAHPALESRTTSHA